MGGWGLFSRLPGVGCSRGLCDGMRGLRPMFLHLHGAPFEGVVYVDAVFPDKYLTANIACIPSLPVGAQGKKDKEGCYREPKVIG